MRESPSPGLPGGEGRAAPLDAAVHLVGDGGASWVACREAGATVWARGSGFLGGKLLDAFGLATLFARAARQPDPAFLNTLAQVEGCFALAARSATSVYAAVDRVRSIPLFYGVRAGRAFLSDDARWVLGQTADNEIDDVAAAEFLLAGYVTGRDTLYPRVKQLQAGEALAIVAGPDGPAATTHRHYRYYPRPRLEARAEDCLEALDEALLRAFERLISWANGRTLVVPLSGGYDSRLIALMLKRLKYDSVLAFSYGRPGNAEARASEEVARRLGIQWHFVPYSAEGWHRWYHSGEYRAYARVADGLASVPHLQDWPAVRELGARGLVPGDSAFVPGHTVALSAMGLPRGRTAPELAGAIIRKHFALWPWSSCPEESTRRLSEKVLAEVAEAVESAGGDGSGALESWEWQERHAKYVVNSVRAYGFWGYDWHLPLWDAGLMRCWGALPLQFRRDKRVYRAYVDRLAARIVGPGWTPGTSSGLSGVGQRARLALRDTPIYPLARAAGTMAWRLARRWAGPDAEYDGHPLAWYGVVPRERFRELYTGKENVVSFLALDRLGRATLW